MIEQGHKSEQQQEINRISSFPEDDKILARKAEMESCNEENKELLERDRWKTSAVSQRGYNDWKKVRAATMKINMTVSSIKTEAITKNKLGTTCCWHCCYWDNGYKNKDITGNRLPNWQKRVLEKQKTLHKKLGQSNKMERTAKQKRHIKAWKKIDLKAERCWSGSRRRSTEVSCCWNKTRKIWL